MSIKLEQGDILALEDFAEEFDVELRKDYSGRGMYGKTCIGFVTANNPLGLAVELVEFLHEKYDDIDVLEEIIDELKNPSIDSMGTSSIVYFRGMAVEE